jgi:F0F1-type ATP synthase membrane subunit b/b'
MKRLVSIILSAVFVISLGIVATASTPYINRREREEQRRIRQGVRNGELTRREAGRLEAEQARIRVAERFARADGTVTRRERYSLNRMLNHASRDIHRQKHDSQDRLP